MSDDKTDKEPSDMNCWCNIPIELVLWLLKDSFHSDWRMAPIVFQRYLAGELCINGFLSMGISLTNFNCLLFWFTSIKTWQASKIFKIVWLLGICCLFMKDGTVFYTI